MYKDRERTALGLIEDAFGPVVVEVARILIPARSTLSSLFKPLAALGISQRLVRPFSTTRGAELRATGQRFTDCTHAAWHRDGLRD
jgi:hypothetical protein